MPEQDERTIHASGGWGIDLGRRELRLRGRAIGIGGRAFEIIEILVRAGGEMVGKYDLMNRVWPGAIVEDNTLQFHISEIRRALGADRELLKTMWGRGYCLLGRWEVQEAIESGHRVVSRSGGKTPPVAGPVPDAQCLPARLTRMVGRAEGVLSLSTELAASRFVTIVGPGGVGKTTVAIAVAHGLLESFAGAVLFIDLGSLSDPRMVAMSLASMLGLSVQSDDPTPNLVAHLHDKRLLLILDNCEHVVDAAAKLAALIFVAASQLHILATSREALRVEGEHVYRLDSLACPPDDPRLTATAALNFPATQLFMERAAAGGARLDLSESDAAIVAGICRKLDGVPLAIELAAGRVGAYGLQLTAVLLDQHLALLWRGRRTAPPRQQTLRATLDWSYGLLSELERVVLRRLAVFVGQFTLDAALAVVPCATVDEAAVFGTIDGLIAKSMVATRPAGAMMHYRLLDTTRAYLLEIGMDEVERDGLAARYATYYRRWLEHNGAKWPGLSNSAERALYLANLDNVRAALEWCFDADGYSKADSPSKTHVNTEIGIGLAAAAAFVFWAMYLPAECRRWSERAILALNDDTRGGPDEMRLQVAFGLSLMHAGGIGEAARAAFDRSLAIAEEHDETFDQLLPLNQMHHFHLYNGDCRTALNYARRSLAVAITGKNPIAIAMAQTVVGVSLHYSGDLSGARREFEATHPPGPNSDQDSTTFMNLGGQLAANSTLARTLWLQGYPAQAVERAHRTVAKAVSLDLPAPLSDTLNLAITVFLWAGDLQSAEKHNDWYLSLAQSQLDIAMGRGHKGAVAIQRGDAKSGVENLLGCIDAFRAAHFALPVTPFSIPLVQGLAAIGRFAEGVALVEDTIRRAEIGGNLIYMPELLRVKGKLLFSMPELTHDDSETCFMQSLEVSRGQGAISWELRTATSLAELWRSQGRIDAARDLLAPVYAQFTEGYDTADLMTAKCLLDELT